MLGYTSNDIYKMMAGVKLAIMYVPPGKAADEIRDELHNTYNFLDGLLAEGHVM